MSVLEEQYRAALKWYPVSWRAKNEDAMVGTLLDTAEGAGRTKPRPLEVANLAVHGIGNRLRLIPSVIPSSVRDRASTAALALGAAIAVAAAMQLESSPNRYVELFGSEYPTFGPVASPAIFIYGTWVAAFFTAIVGGTRTARWMVLATFPLSIGARAFADANDMMLRPTWSFLGLLLLLAVLVTAGRPAPTRAGVGWLVAWFLPAAIVFTLPQTLLNPHGFAFQEPLWLDRPDMISWSPLIALLLAAILKLVHRNAWAAGVLLLGIPFTAAAFPAGAPLEVAWLALLGGAAILAMVLILRVFGFRVQLQRVPPRTPSNRGSGEDRPIPDPQSRTTGTPSRWSRRWSLIALTGTCLALATAGATWAADHAYNRPPELVRSQSAEDVLSSASAASLVNSSTRFIGTVEDADIYLGEQIAGGGICVISTQVGNQTITSTGCGPTGSGGAIFGITESLSVGVGNTLGLPVKGESIRLSESVVAFVTTN